MRNIRIKYAKTLTFRRNKLRYSQSQQRLWTG
nr:MAG TPA: hypothetical protein [Caudoviricetes sp.]